MAGVAIIWDVVRRRRRRGRVRQGPTRGPAAVVEPTPGAEQAPRAAPPPLEPGAAAAAPAGPQGRRGARLEREAHRPDETDTGRRIRRHGPARGPHIGYGGLQLDDGLHVPAGLRVVVLGPIPLPPEPSGQRDIPFGSLSGAWRRPLESLRP